jgi:hypothetical protein
VPKTEVDKKGAWESLRCILNALEARMSLMMHKGMVGAVGTTDKAVMGYYLVKWLSEPFTLQEDTRGMFGMIPAGATVVDALYFNRVQHAPLWYRLAGNMIIMEVKYVLQTDLQLQPISATNALPNACTRLKATQKKAIRELPLDHKAITEEATKHDRLEYKGDNKAKSNGESKESKESELESE